LPSNDRGRRRFESPAAESLARLGVAPTQLIRQTNQGLLFARLAGFAHATAAMCFFSTQTIW